MRKREDRELYLALVARDDAIGFASRRTFMLNGGDLIPREHDVAFIFLRAESEIDATRVKDCDIARHLHRLDPHRPARKSRGEGAERPLEYVDGASQCVAAKWEGHADCENKHAGGGGQKHGAEDC